MEQSKIMQGGRRVRNKMHELGNPNQIDEKWDCDHRSSQLLQPQLWS